MRNRTELECIIADFETAGEVGEYRRAELAEELEMIQQKIDEANARLEDLVAEAEQKIGKEKTAREA